MTKEFDLYEVGGYNSGKIGFGNMVGIVSVDMMNCVTDPKAPMGRSPMGQAAIDKCAILFEMARENGIPIVHCQTAFQSDLSDMPRWKVSCMKQWIIGSWEVEIDLGLRKQLRADIDLIQLKIKLANIGLMPLLVILFGIGFFIRKRKKTAAI